MNVLIVGAGMYVTGRGTTGIGTVLPALAQVSRSLHISSVTVVATQAANAEIVSQNIERIRKTLGVALPVKYRVLRNTLQETIDDLPLDCAIISVPDDKHFEVAQALMRKRIHCLIVKPLTPTLAEARALKQLQDDMGLYCAVEFHKRFDEQNILVRKLLRDGRLGRPLYMVVGYSQRITIPQDIFRGWAERTNIFQYLGVHYIDLIYFLTGLTPMRVSAVGTRGVLDSKGIKTWDSVHATVIWQRPGSAEEFVSQLAIGWVDPPATSALSDQKFLLVGSEGRMDLDQTDRGVKLVTPEGIETLNPYFSMLLDDADGSPVFQGYGVKSIQRYMQDVQDVIDKRIQPKSLQAVRPSLEQAIVSTAVVEAVNLSLGRKGEWCAVDSAA